MSFTEITPYDGQLPSSSDPASFDGRASALMSWLVANFAPEIQALAVEIATALNGEEDTLAAVQALSDSLKSAAFKLAIDDPDFAEYPNALPTRSAVAGYVGELALGVNQTWQDVTASRVYNTAYQNTTGRPINVVIIDELGAGGHTQVSVDGTTWLNIGYFHPDNSETVSFVVPDGTYYRVSYGGSNTSADYWMELR